MAKQKATTMVQVKNDAGLKGKWKEEFKAYLEVKIEQSQC